MTDDVPAGQALGKRRLAAARNVVARGLMRATLMVRERLVFDDGAILEIKVWLVPQPVPPSTHHLKYSCFYGRPGTRIVGYDNERRKGDHRHLGSREESYRFTSIERLLADFRADVEAARGERI